MNLLPINPVWVGGISSLNIGLILDDRAEEASLYTTDSIDKGCQLFKFSLGLFPLA